MSRCLQIPPQAQKMQNLWLVSDHISYLISNSSFNFYPVGFTRLLQNGILSIFYLVCDLKAVFHHHVNANTL